MFATLAALSCSKSEMDQSLELEESNGLVKIEFTSQDETQTRGVAVDNFGSSSELNVYAIVHQADVTEECYIDDEQLLYAGSGSSDGVTLWSLAADYYYPAAYTLDFFAYSPCVKSVTDSDWNGAAYVFDVEDKSMEITYNSPTAARNMSDIMIATPVVDQGSTSEAVNLSFKHIFTQVTMSAKLATATLNSTEIENPTERFAITRFVINNIHTSGVFTCAVDEAGASSMEWNLGSDDDTHAFITSAMLPDPDLYEDEERVMLNGEYQSIMSNGHSLMMIPQPIEASTSSSGVPTIQITIWDSVDDVYYRTDLMTLPSPDNLGWVMGDAINLLFEFDVDSDGIVIPMAFYVDRIDWVIDEIDKELDANAYAYLDTNIVAANSSTTIMLYTNKSLESVASTSANISGVAYSAVAGGYQLTIDAAAAGDGSIAVVLDNSDEKTITKTFAITVQ